MRALQVIHSNPQVASSQAKIVENFENYFTKAIALY